jgi:hypothetical protein
VQTSDRRVTVPIRLLLQSFNFQCETILEIAKRQQLFVKNIDLARFFGVTRLPGFRQFYGAANFLKKVG